MEEFNVLSLAVTVLLALLGTPVLLRRAGYPWGKTVFGSLTAMVVLLGVWGIMSTVQRKAGLDALPLGWLVPLAAVAAAWHLQRRET
jgi:lipopolysaccharide export LptBFGC system permease protein LptF